MKVFFLAALCLSLLSCEREPAKSNFGPPTSLQAIADAQQASILKLDPYSIQQGQRVHSIESQEVISSQGPAKLLSKEWVISVTHVEDFQEEHRITTHKEMTDKLWDKEFVYEFKDVISLPQLDSFSAFDPSGLDRYSLSNTLLRLREAGEVQEKDIDGVAFHNLQKQEVVLVPPELVKSASKCKGLPDCRIRADKISYDIIFRLTDGSTQRHTVEWFISAEVPFFAALLKHCATTVLPVESLRVLVKQCNEIVDFDN